MHAGARRDCLLPRCATSSGPSAIIAAFFMTEFLHWHCHKLCITHTASKIKLILLCMCALHESGFMLVSQWARNGMPCLCQI